MRFSLGFLTLSLLGAHTAQAYLLFRNPQGENYRWPDVRNRVVRWETPAGAPPILRQAMQNVSRLWGEATYGALRLEEGPGGILISWDETGKEIPDRLFLAYAWFNIASGTRDIVGGRVVVNAANYAWHLGSPRGVSPPQTGQKRRVDLEGVMLHELGHVLGMDHADRAPQSIVGPIGPNNYPTMNSVIYPGAETPHLDDETGIRVAYKEDVGPPPPIAITARPYSRASFRRILFSPSWGDAQCQWDFGYKGKHDVGFNVEFRYPKDGNYLVTVVCGNRSGSQLITVRKPPKFSNTQELSHD